MYSGTYNLSSFIGISSLTFAWIFFLKKLKLDDFFYTITSPLGNKIAYLSVISGFYFLGKEMQEPFFYTL